MSQESMSAYDFKKGDKITRIKPSKPIKIFSEEELEDRAYIGSELIFVGIANGCVYVEKPMSSLNLEDLDMPGFDELIKLMIGKGEKGLINLPLDVWTEGWAYYVDPLTLGDEKSVDDMTIKETMGLTKDTSVLKKELKEALSKENYERAKIIQKELDRRD